MRDDEFVLEFDWEWSWWDRTKNEKKRGLKTAYLNEWVNLKHQSIVLLFCSGYSCSHCASAVVKRRTRNARLERARAHLILVPCHLERTLAQFGPFQPLMNSVFVVGVGQQPAWIHEGFQKIRGKKCARWGWRGWPRGGWERLLWLIVLSGLYGANNGWDIWRVN